ncbi:MAG: multiheme c-type cytochrome [bacterium]
MPRLPKLKLPKLSQLPLPTHPRKRRLTIFLLGFAGLVLLQQLPGLFFSWWLGYPWEQHGLSIQWRILSITLDVGVVLAFILSEVKAFWRWLPRLYLLMLGLLFFCVWSALYLKLGDRSSPFAFQLLMWHMFAGRTAAPLFGIYLFQHIVAWRPTAVPNERRWGKRLTIFTAVTLGVGLAFTVLGGPSERIFLPVHEYGSLVLPFLVIAHIQAERRWRERKSPAPATLAARVPSFGRRETLIALAISALVPLAPWALANGQVNLHFSGLFRFVEATPKDLYRTVAPPSTYQLPFGAGAFAPSRFETTSRQLVPARFLNQANTCSYEGCHTDIGKQWAISGHRHARNVFVEKAMGALAAERGIAATRYCAGCHDPVNLAAGQIDEGGTPTTGIANEGVTCVACHAAAHLLPRPGDASLVLGATPLFFERAIDKSSYLMTVLYLEEHRAELDRRGTIDDLRLCEACHRHTVPEAINPHRPVITQRVQEWRDSPFAKPPPEHEARNCHSCHMPATMESYQSTEIKGHRFLSSNTAIPAYYANDPAYDAYAERYFRGVQQAKFTHAENLEWVQTQLKSKIVTLDLGTEAAAGEGGSAVTLVATTTNRGVGHGWPAGIPDLVDVWLEIEARDANGAVVWSSGVPDEHGRVPPDAYRFGEDWFDDDGNRLTHHETWKLATVRNQRRLASGTSDVARFAFTVPDSTPQPIRVRARLRHRRFHQDFIEWVLGPGGTLPITDLQDETIELPART